MATKKPYKLTLTKLDFLSSCDVPAQGVGGAALLCKRGSDDFKLTAKVSKLSDELGLVFGYAFAASLDGGKTPHVDSQNDAIDPDFLKTVTEFLEAGGATDVNHDFAQDGKIVYAWPLLPEINQAMGIKSDTIGLAVAVKPSAETYQAFKRGELTGFSIAGTGIREPLEKSSGHVVKASLYTNEVDGHQHEVCVCDDGSFYVCYATSAGAENSHSHGIVFENGQLTILADSGHSHELAEGQPGVAVVPADAIVVVAARALPTMNGLDTSKGARATANKSTHRTAVRDGSLTTEKSQMDKDKQIADLTAKNVELEKRNGALSRMSAVAFAVFKSLAANDAEAFLAKSSAEQDAAAADIAKRNDEADKVIYVSKTTGDVYKAKDDPRLVEMAKRMDAQADEIEKADIAKQAAEVLGGMPGDDATHQLIVKAIRKSGADAEAVKKAFETLTGMKATSTIGKKAPGVSGDGSIASGSTDDAMTALTKGLTEFCKAQGITKNIWSDGLDAFKQTEKGAALKRAVDEAAA